MDPQLNQAPAPMDPIPPSSPVPTPVPPPPAPSFVQGSQFVNYGHTPASAGAPIQPRPPIISRPKRSHHVWPTVLVVILLLVILGLGAAYVFAFAPDHALPRAATVLSGKRKFSANITVSSDSSDPETSGSFSLSANTDGTSGSIRNQSLIDFESPAFPVSAEIRFVDNVLYGQITHVPPLVAQYVAPYQNKWYSVSLATLKSWAEKYHATSTLGIGGPTIAEQYAKAISEGVLTDRRFIGITYSGGSLVRRYSLTINKDALINQIVSSSVATDNDQFESVVAQAKQAYAAVSFEPIIVNVDLISGALVSFDGAMDIAAGQISPSSKEIKITFQASYTDISPGADLSAPTNVTSLDSYLLDAMNSLGAAQDTGTSARIKADVLQGRVAMEALYSATTFYAGGCSSRDVTQLLADMRSHGSTPVCETHGQTYYLAAPLLDTSTPVPSYYCVDSTGSAGNISRLPTGYSCN